MGHYFDRSAHRHSGIRGHLAGSGHPVLQAAHIDWAAMVLGSSPFTLAVAAAGAFGFFARAPQFGSLSGVTYVRPFLSDSHGGSIPEGEPSSVHTSIVVRRYRLFSVFWIPV